MAILIVACASTEGKNTRKSRGLTVSFLRKQKGSYRGTKAKPRFFSSLLAGNLVSALGILQETPQLKQDMTRTAIRRYELFGCRPARYSAE